MRLKENIDGKRYMTNRQKTKKTKTEIREHKNTIGIKFFPIIFLTIIGISLFIKFKTNDDITNREKNKEKPNQEEIQEIKMT